MNTNSMQDLPPRYLRVITLLQRTKSFDWKTVSAKQIGKMLQDQWGDSAASTWNLCIAAIVMHEKHLKLSGKRTVPLLPIGFGYKKVPKRLPKPVPEQVIKQILEDVTDPQDKLLLETLAASGLRATEVATLTFKQIDTLGIVTVIGKGDKERQTFLTQEAQLALHAWTHIGHMLKQKQASKDVMLLNYLTYTKDNPDKGIFIAPTKPVRELTVPSNWVYYQVKKYTEYSPHQFRHFWVTDLLNNGADLMAVMDAAGHESISTTRGYKKILTRQMTALRSMHSREQGRL